MSKELKGVGEGEASMDERGGDESISIVEAMLNESRGVEGVGVTNIITRVPSLDCSTRLLLLPLPLTVMKGILVCTSLTSMDVKMRDGGRDLG